MQLTLFPSFSVDCAAYPFPERRADIFPVQALRKKIGNNADIAVALELIVRKNSSLLQRHHAGIDRKIPGVHALQIKVRVDLFIFCLVRVSRPAACPARDRDRLNSVTVVVHHLLHHFLRELRLIAAHVSVLIQLDSVLQPHVDIHGVDTVHRILAFVFGSLGVSHGHDRDNRGYADDDAQHGKESPQFIGGHAFKSKPYILTQHARLSFPP